MRAGPSALSIGLRSNMPTGSHASQVVSSVCSGTGLSIAYLLVSGSSPTASLVERHSQTAFSIDLEADVVPQDP